MYLKKLCSKLFRDIRMGNLNNEVGVTLVTLTKVTKDKVGRKVRDRAPVPDPHQLQALPCLHFLGEIPAQRPKPNNTNPHHPFETLGHLDRSKGRVKRKYGSHRYFRKWGAAAISTGKTG